MILEEFDANKSAVINPDDIYHKVKGFPETVVSVFSKKLFDSLAEKLGGVKITESHDVGGRFPIYEINFNGKKVAFAQARLGAPACVGVFENIAAFGAKRIILLGSCGVLDKSIEDCGIIIPTKAIRDEGTSYHYAPPSDFINVNHNHVTQFEELLDEKGIKHIKGVTWTTDAFYRETKSKVDKRRRMGAVCVEMECAAMQAFADFRGIDFFQFLYAGDNLDAEKWQPRSLSSDLRLDEKEKLVILAFELAEKIEKKVYADE